jgi:hypothetical protein
MTLNLTVVTPQNVYQCSDFRLTYSGGDYTDEEAQKVIVISTFKWTALLQFCGVAKTTAGFDVTEWLAKLVPRIQSNASLGFLETELLSVGRRQIGNAGPTSFSVAGFNGARPFTILVSNFQSLPDTRQTFSTGWKASRSTQKKIAFATGTGGDFVRPDELKTLSQIAHRLPPLDVQRKMATLNKTAAARAGPNGSVSESCFSGHLRNNGTGELIPHDVNPGGEYLPAFALNLVRVNELKAKVDANGNPLPRRLVQMALTRTGAAVMIVAELANIEGPPGFKGSPPPAPAAVEHLRR